MKRTALVFLLLSGCAAQKCPQPCWKEISEMKQELALAQNKLQTQRTYITQLEEEIARQEIAVIQKEIGQVNKQEAAKQMLTHEEWLGFFYHQREILNEIIRSDLSCRSDAQEVLDQILILITQLSDQAFE